MNKYCCNGHHQEWSLWLNFSHGKIFQVCHKGYDLLVMIIGTCLVCFDLLTGIWLNVGQILNPVFMGHVAHGDLPTRLKRFRCAEGGSYDIFS